MRQITRVMALTLTLAVVSTGLATGGPWADAFDDYPPGPIDGLGGWAGSGTVLATPDVLSPPHMLRITNVDSAIHQFDVTDGIWEFSAWSWVPPDLSDNVYFILLNTYAPGGPFNWSLDLEFDGAAGLVTDLESGQSVPIVLGQWAQIRVEIDLAKDIVRVEYDGVHVSTRSWSQGGEARLQAVSLWGDNTIHAIYFDDMTLTQRTCPWDFDGNGAVDFQDLLSVLSQWGPCAGCLQDLDDDGEVGFADLLLLLSNWGACQR